MGRVFAADLLLSPNSGSGSSRTRANPNAIVMATPDTAAMCTPRVCFSQAETIAFLAIVDEMRIGELLDSRRQCNQVPFVRIQEETSRLGYTWTWQQLRTHWKNLKGRYNKVSDTVYFFSNEFTSSSTSTTTVRLANAAVHLKTS